MTDTQFICSLLAFVVVASFLMGVDAGLRDRDARLAQIRYCGSAHHIEKLCNATEKSNG